VECVVALVLEVDAALERDPAVADVDVEQLGGDRRSTPPPAGSDTPFAELVADPQAADAASTLDRAETRREIQAAMSLLAPRVRRVLELRFGLGGEVASTHEPIGPLLGISPERSRQIEADELVRPAKVRGSWPLAGLDVGEGGSCACRRGSCRRPRSSAVVAGAVIGGAPAGALVGVTADWGHALDAVAWALGRPPWRRSPPGSC
jgi:hypothetical protein